MSTPPNSPVKRPREVGDTSPLAKKPRTATPSYPPSSPEIGGHPAMVPLDEYDEDAIYTFFNTKWNTHLTRKPEGVFAQALKILADNQVDGKQHRIFHYTIFHFLLIYFVFTGVFLFGKDTKDELDKALVKLGFPPVPASNLADEIFERKGK